MSHSVGLLQRGQVKSVVPKGFSMCIHCKAAFAVSGHIHGSRRVRTAQHCMREVSLPGGTGCAA